MIIPHCDRCHVEIVAGYASWVIDDGAPFDALGKPLPPAEERLGSQSPIWHVEIDAGGDLTRRFEKMFCRTCRITILETYVAKLKEMPT